MLPNKEYESILDNNTSYVNLSNKDIKYKSTQCRESKQSNSISHVFYKRFIIYILYYHFIIYYTLF